MKFTNAELEARIIEHNNNANTKLKLMTWNKNENTVEENQLKYKTTQAKFASAFSELLWYREQDPNYTE